MAFLGDDLNIPLSKPKTNINIEMNMMGDELNKNQKKILKWHNELDRLEKRKGALLIALDLQNKMDESIYDTKSEFYQKNVVSMREDRIELENELEHSKKNIEDHWKKMNLGIDVDESEEKKIKIHKSRNEFLDNIPKRGVTKTYYKSGEKLPGFPKKMGGRKKTRKKARKKRRKTRRKTRRKRRRKKAGMPGFKRTKSIKSDLSKYKGPIKTDPKQKLREKAMIRAAKKAAEKTSETGVAEITKAMKNL